MVDAEAVTVSIAVSKETTLKHLVGRRPDARYEVAGVEGGLLNLGEVVIGVVLQNQLSNLDKGVVALRPHFFRSNGFRW